MPLLTAAHPTTVQRIHHGSAAIVERFPYSASSEQLGVLASFQIIVHGVVLGTVSSSFPILFCHEAEESDNMVVANQPAWSQQIGGLHSVIQAFQRWVLQSCSKNGWSVTFLYC